MALLLSPASLQQEIKILNIVIFSGIEYTFYATLFSIPDIKKLKLLIKTHTVRSPKTPPDILAQPSHETFGIEAFSLLPIYATTLSERFTHQ